MMNLEKYFKTKNIIKVKNEKEWIELLTFIENKYPQAHWYGAERKRKATFCNDQYKNDICLSFEDWPRLWLSDLNYYLGSGYNLVVVKCNRAVSIDLHFEFNESI